MLRGIERSRIFHDDTDRWDFVERLSRLIPELHFRCFGWALMDNHVHAVLQTWDVPLARLMARLNTGYAKAFNERHGRVGHLLQNRFRSRLVRDEADLAGLVAYVHANPLKADCVRSEAALRDFPWCGHGALMGNRPPLPFESVRETLRLFGSDPASARANLRQQIACCIAEPTASTNVEPLDPWARGTSPPPQNLRGISMPLHTPNSGSFASLAEIEDAACDHFGIRHAALRSGARSSAIARTRGAVAFGAVHVLGMPIAEVARYLGVSPGAISRAVARGARDYARLAELHPTYSEHDAPRGVK